MRNWFLFILIAIFFLPFPARVGAQAPIPYNNGQTTQPINFTSACVYQWVNDNPAIGLPANGSGNIPSFTAVNNGTTPITATITARPAPQGYAYIGNYGDNTMSVINTATNQKVATFPLVAQPGGVFATSNGAKVYIVNTNANSVSIVGSASNSVLTTFDVGGSPSSVAISPDGTILYVANVADNSISIINAANNITIGSILGFDQPYFVAISPDGNTLYVANSPTGTVSVVSTGNRMITNKINVGSDPIQVVVSADGSKVYSTNQQSNNISVISTSSNTVTGTINVGNKPYGEAISPDGNYLYVGCSGDGVVDVIDTKTNQIIKTITVGGLPIGMSITSDGSELYVTNDSDPGSVSVISTVNYLVTNVVPVGKYPYSMGNFILANLPCNGPAETITIVVYPASGPLPVITANPATGTISSCQGLASVSPNIQSFTVSGIYLTADINAAAPAGFEISLSPNTGYATSLTLKQTGGTVNNTMVYVRSASSAPVGNLSDNVVLTSTAATTQNVAVAGTINAKTSPAVSIAASANNVCAGTSVTFTATPTNGGAAPTYQWQVNGANTGAPATDATFTSSSLNNGDIVTCIMASNATCAVPANVTSNSITMIVNPSVSPAVTISASASTICFGTPVTFTATSTNGGTAPAYQWQVNDAGTGTSATDATFTSSSLNNGDIVTCIMTGNAPCAAPATAASNAVTITVNPLPTADAGPDKTINQGSSTVLNATATGNIAGITWSPVSGLSDYKVLNPVASPLSTTTYTLTVESVDGCFATDAVKVSVIADSFEIPNAFTPNGDGVNDTWNIKYLSSVANCSVDIFTRWGRKIYSSIGYAVAWDGTYKGSPLPSGTYYYMINLKDGHKPLSGFVTIIR